MVACYIRFYCFVLCWATSHICFSLTSSDSFFDEIHVYHQPDTSEKIHNKFYLQQKVSLGVDIPDQEYGVYRNYRGLRQFQTDLYAEIRQDMGSSSYYVFSGQYEINFKDQYRRREGTEPWVTLSSLFILKDAYVDILFDNDQWLRVGNQLFAWGESETLPIIDILSLRDQRDLAQSKLDDIRQQVPALMYSVPALDGRVELISTYHARYDRYERKGGEFYPWASLGLNHHFTVARPKNDWEYALKYDGHIYGADVVFVIADTNTNELYVNGSSSRPNTLILSQERVSILGASINYVLSKWLLKGEVGLNWNQPVNIDDQFYEEDQLRFMLGFERSIAHNWLMRYEMMGIVTPLNNKEPQYNNNIRKVPMGVEALGHTIHFQTRHWNNRVIQDVWLFDLLGDNGQMVRWDLHYDWFDAVSLTSSLIVYSSQDNDQVLYPYRNNDTLNLSVKYSF